MEAFHQLYNKPSLTTMEKLIIANWKEHKTIRESLEFLEKFQSLLSQIDLKDKKIVICPPFLSLSEVSKFAVTRRMPIAVGAQDISGYDEGAYTGEISGRQIREVAEFVIIGHSERRKYFHESDNDIEKKTAKAHQAGLIPIVCVRSEKDAIPENSTYVAFEPVEAIGTGNPEDPKRVKDVFTKISSGNDKRKMIYGGSVDHASIGVYTKIPLAAGFLIGGASLDPDSFAGIIEAC